jgi:hypothetical protein
MPLASNLGTCSDRSALITLLLNFVFFFLSLGEENRVESAAIMNVISFLMACTMSPLHLVDLVQVRVLAQADLRLQIGPTSLCDLSDAISFGICGPGYRPTYYRVDKGRRRLMENDKKKKTTKRRRQSTTAGCRDCGLIINNSTCTYYSYRQARTAQCININLFVPVRVLVQSYNMVHSVQNR